MDTQTALRARTNLRFIVEHWPDLVAELRPGGGGALTGMPRAKDAGDPVPINVGISDLMREIEDEARSLGHVLMDETDDWVPSTSSMPTLLAEVAERYGHWTAGDERTALDFSDWAEEYAGKVHSALWRPEPAEFVGPCRTPECAGDLYLRPGRDGGRCRECGEDFTRSDQLEFVESALEGRLMTASEIGRALKILGHTVKPGTVHSWVERKRLIAVVDDPALYRLADAMVLIESGKRVAA